ncbi:hypothetical protein FisN_7Lh051 [Fistulifera solaris]|uniref:Uncharacterized protein n=1 Tax=Fistulifera solaris TaxID=1519565 RepID=A0A1Z5JCF1_FISSO|nr:hypothetical protein FisN_7Lh051 [Fistulifera solaris]|eukprot:GAX11683.1 hypothetical protein FisN_7Lh051 [Fistulifera solaris]
MQPTSDDIACFNMAMTLNNIAVSLIDKRCHAKAIEIFCDALTLLKSGHPCEDAAHTFVSKANQYIANFNQHQVRAAQTGAFASPFILSDDDLITIARSELDENAMQDNMSFKCYLIQFSAPHDFATKAYHVDVVVATVLNNMASAYISADTKQSSLEGVLAGAHELWSLSLSSVDSFLYDFNIVDEYMKMQQRAMQILVLRCVKETATLMKMEEVASAFSTALLEEYMNFHNMLIVRSISSTRTCGAAAA